MISSHSRSVLNRAIALALLIVGEVACVPPEPLILRPDKAPASTSASTNTPSAMYRLRLIKIEDRRIDKVALGSVAGRPVRAPQDTEAWIQGLLRTLPAKGVNVSFPGAHAPSEQGVQAEAQLVTAWVSSLATSMSANVVMRFRFLRADGSTDERDYRGYETSVNWNSGDDEIQVLLNEAFNKALTKVAADVTELSKQPSAASNPEPIGSK